MIWSLGHKSRIRSALSRALEGSGSLHFFDTLNSMRALLESNPPDLIISEYEFKGGTVLDLLPCDTQIIVLSVLDEIGSIRKCLEAGIADYLVHPASPALLRAKVEHFSVRVADARGAFLGVHLSSDGQLLARLNHSVELTRKETKIMRALLGARDRGMKRKELLAQTWKGVHVTPKAFDVHLFNLRRKVRPLGVDIRFDPVAGYFLQLSES